MEAPNAQERVSDAKERLAREFSGQIEPATIEAIIQEVASQLEDAPVRAYVPVLVERHARERLRELAHSQRAG